MAVSDRDRLGAEAVSPQKEGTPTQAAHQLPLEWDGAKILLVDNETVSFHCAVRNPPAQLQQLATRLDEVDPLLVPYKTERFSQLLTVPTR